MNIPDTPKTIAHCTCCDGECYDTIERFPDEHSLAGQPRNVGALKEGAKRVEFILADLSTMTLTFCGECVDVLKPEHYPAIMGRVIASWEEEIDDDWRAKRNLKLWTEEQKANQRKLYSSKRIMGKWCDRPREAG